MDVGSHSINAPGVSLLRAWVSHFIVGCFRPDDRSAQNNVRNTSRSIIISLSGTPVRRGMRLSTLHLFLTTLPKAATDRRAHLGVLLDAVSNRPSECP